MLPKLMQGMFNNLMSPGKHMELQTNLRLGFKIWGMESMRDQEWSLHHTARVIFLQQENNNLTNTHTNQHAEEVL